MSVTKTFANIDTERNIKQMTNLTPAVLLLIEQSNVRKITLNKEICTIGRESADYEKITGKTPDIALRSSIASKEHGMFRYIQGYWYYKNTKGRNGTFVDGHYLHDTQQLYKLSEGSVIRIDSGHDDDQYRHKGVLIYFSTADSNQRWKRTVLDFRNRGMIVCGRGEDCDIQLDTVSVSRHHGMFTQKNGQLAYRDLGSTNGTFKNGEKIAGETIVHEKDILVLGNVQMICLNNIIIYTAPDSGGYLEISDLTRIVDDAEHKGSKKVILDRVTVDIPAGKLAAVLGTSGAGKTTFLNSAMAYEEATSGSVKINGNDLYENKKVMKKQIGYVPQDDLLRSGLSLWKTLEYTGRLRLPKDVGREERHRKIDSVIRMLGLEDQKNNRIRKLSGGQRKRVSIASELISDPPLLFLDEPTSGLDPQTETELVETMADLAHKQGKTLVVNTHTIMNIDKFDMILFFGPGGRLCFSGTPAQALSTFKVDRVADIYPIVKEHSKYWQERRFKEMKGAEDGQ